MAPKNLLNTSKNGQLYTIYVDIIECRDLKPINDDDICDPICSVNIFKKKLSTKKCMKPTFSPYFDQTLVFKINLTSNQLLTEKIKISVYDTNNMTRNILIGSYQFDLSYISQNEHHEIYKQWIGLFNPNEINKGIKGYLKCSITVLSPNDEKFIHSNSIKNEQESDHNDLDINNVILPPFIQYQYKQLIINIYKTKFLPNLFSNNRNNKITNYKIIIQFSDKKLQSKQIECNNNDNNQEIINWNISALLPLRIPNFQKDVLISIFQENKLISRLIVDYNKLNDDDDIKWYNLYGSHFDIKKYLQIQNKHIANKMNNGIIETTCFRGQIGINCQIISCHNDEPQTQILPIIKDKKEEHKYDAEYMIQVDIYEATNVNPGRYRIRVECGSQLS